MQVTKVIVNLQSEDQFEVLYIFDDGYVVAGDEKSTIVVDPTGKKVGESYKAVCEEPHGLATQEYVERYGYGTPEDFTPETLKQFLEIMGPHSAMLRGDTWFGLRGGKIVEV